MRKILHQYIFREILVPFVLGLGVFTFVLSAQGLWAMRRGQTPVAE